MVSPWLQDEIHSGLISVEILQDHAIILEYKGGFKKLGKCAHLLPLRGFLTKDGGMLWGCTKFGRNKEYITHYCHIPVVEALIGKKHQNAVYCSTADLREIATDAQFIPISVLNYSRLNFLDRTDDPTTDTEAKFRTIDLGEQRDRQ